MSYALGREPRFNEDETWLCSVDEGWARAALALRGQTRFGHSNDIRARSLPALHKVLEARRIRFYQGGSMELLHAVQFCAAENVPMPQWLALAFCEYFGKFLKEGTTLDAVFSSENLPTSAQKARTARRDWQRGIPIWDAVRAVAGQHTSLDGAVGEVLAQSSFGIGKTKARELVEMIDATQVELSQNIEPLSQIFKKARKEAKAG